MSSGAIEDIKVLVHEVVQGVGAVKVARMMEESGNWQNVNVFNIPAYIGEYFETEVDEEDFNAMLEEVHSEFYNIALEYDYNITQA